MVLGFTGVVYQNKSNTTTLTERVDAMNKRLDDTNEHLRLLNNKTFDSHREIGAIMGAFNALDCRRGVKDLDCTSGCERCSTRS
jgi:hypothetical protein